MKILETLQANSWRQSGVSDGPFSCRFSLFLSASDARISGGLVCGSLDRLPVAANYLIEGFNSTQSSCTTTCGSSLLFRYVKNTTRVVR